MAVPRPFRRTCRQFTDVTTYRNRYFVLHPQFAQAPEHYVRAFLLLQKDLQNLFDYVEPADQNLNCYSYRIHSLLLRACVEVEANCKAILKENGYTKSKDMNMDDYKKINTTHRLSSYQVKIPNWNGTKDTRTPFAAWATGGSLPWYQAYNTAKHDRLAEFEKATFEHLLDASCGLFVLLSAQFEMQDFGPDYIIDGGPNIGIGDYFHIEFPNDWPDDMKYDFDWETLKKETDPFQEFDYTKIT